MFVMTVCTMTREFIINMEVNDERKNSEKVLCWKIYRIFITGARWRVEVEFFFLVLIVFPQKEIRKWMFWCNLLKFHTHICYIIISILVRSNDITYSYMRQQTVPYIMYLYGWQFCTIFLSACEKSVPRLPRLCTFRLKQNFTFLYWFYTGRNRIFFAK